MSGEDEGCEKLFHVNGSPFDSDQWSEHFGCDFCYLWTLNVNDYTRAVEGSVDELASNAFLDTLNGNQWKLVFCTGYNKIGEEYCAFSRISLLSLAPKTKRQEAKYFVSANFLDKSSAIYSPVGRHGVNTVEVGNEAKDDFSVFRLSNFKIPFGIGEHLESICYCDTLRILLRMWSIPDVEANPAPPMAPNFETLLDNPIFGDVTLEVGSSQILAHRAVLAARSSVFREQLLAASKETPDGMVRLNLSDYSPSVVRGMLKYVYTDDYPQGIEAGEALGLIAIAHAHKLERLKLAYERAIVRLLVMPNNGVDANTVVDTLECSIRCSSILLRLSVIKYLKASKVSLVGNPKLEQLATGNLKEVLAVLAAATETDA